VDKTVTPEVTQPWVKYRESAHRDEQHIEFSPNDRVYQSLWRDGHLLTDFVMVQQVKIRGKWRDILKIDCCHQAVHVHHLRLNGSETVKSLQEVNHPADLGIGLEKAQDLIFDKWNNNVRRWERGR